jgi:hypothetical protein
MNKKLFAFLKNPRRENMNWEYIKRARKEYQISYRLAPWTDPTFRLMGDPLPGRSALDRPRYTEPQLARITLPTCAPKY